MKSLKMPKDRTIVAVYIRKSMLVPEKANKLSKEIFSNDWHIEGNKLVSLNEEITLAPVQKVKTHG